MYISIRLDELKGCNGQLIQFNSTVGIDVNVDENIDLQKARQFKVELEDFINERLNGIIEREPIEEEVKEESKEDTRETHFGESCKRDYFGLKESKESRDDWFEVKMESKEEPKESRDDWFEVKEESKEDEKEISFAESCRRDFISRLKECLKRNPEHSEREMMKALIDDYENGNW